MELNIVKLSEILETGFLLGFLWEVLKFKKIPKLCFLTRVQAKPKKLELNNLKLSQIWESGFFLGFLREILKFKKIPNCVF